MTVDDMIKELNEYKQNVYFLKRHVFDRDEMIESIALSAPGFSPVPPSVTNKFSSKTENVVFMIGDKMKEYNDEVKRIARSVSNVLFLLDTLNYEERFLIEAKYIQEHKTWVDIAREYQKMKDINFISVSVIKKIKMNGIKKMVENSLKYELFSSGNNSMN